MRKASEVYFRGDTVFVVTMARTVPAGFVMRLGQMFKLRRDEDPSVWGETVLKSLDLFREGVPQPDLRNAGKELLDFAGVKSWRTFSSKAQYLYIAFEGRELSVIPTTQVTGGFDHLTDQAVKSPPEPQAVGQALVAALALCS